jgi:hypothetical protein
MYRSRLEIMRHIYNCEQTSIPRAISYNDMSDSSSQHIVLITDSSHSSFDDPISSPPSKGQFDFSMKARFVDVVISIVIVLNEYFTRNQIHEDNFLSFLFK